MSGVNEFRESVHQISPLFRHPSAVFINEVRKEDGNIGSALSKFGQTVSNVDKYIEVPLVTQGLTEQAKAESFNRYLEVAKKANTEIGGSILFDEFTRRSRFECY